MAFNPRRGREIKGTGTLVRCVDGPWKGYSLYLSNKMTAVFELHGIRGRYVDGLYTTTDFDGKPL